jgi:urease accessory protein
VLAHDQRHLRRKTIQLTNHTKVLIDMPEPIVLNAGDMLVLEDGSLVMIDAADEDLYDIRGVNAEHMLQLAWHIGNRHLPAELRVDRIYIGRDHVIKTMLEGLGATVTDITGPFSPARGAYSGHGAGAAHSHHHAH